MLRWKHRHAQEYSAGPFRNVKRNVDWDDAIGFGEYEIRFTAEGSEYYASGAAFSFFPPKSNDPKGKGRVPFEIWALGEDLESPACREVQEHLKTCPTCKVYFDTVRKTVTLCRQCEEEEKIPEDVKSRLFKVLHLEEIQNKHNR